MKTQIDIMLVEDNPEYRAVIQFALKRYDDINLCGQFGTTEIALRTLQNGVPNERPNVILLDLRLPGMDGLEALPLFCASAPESKVIVLTQSDNEADVLCAIQRGASGYLLKTASMAEIVTGIRNVMAGGASLDASVARFVLSTLQTKLPENKEGVVLTGRELQTLTLLAEGLVKKEIADRLNISTPTVATYVANIYEKLQVQNGPSAVSKAYCVGILPNK